MTETYERIYAIARKIPAGRVATYGQIAGLAGLSRGARVAGNAMAACPEGSGVPCHRVVDCRGNTKSAFDLFQRGTQRMRLEAEGVPFTEDGRVDLEKCLWDGKIDE